MAAREVDAGDAAVVDLLEKLAQIGAALVIHPRFGEEAAAIAAFEDAGGEIDVFAETHVRKTAERFVHLAAHAHVEGAGIEFVHSLFLSANTAGGEKGGHRVVDCLLHRGEGAVGAIRAAKSIAGGGEQFGIDGGQIPFRQEHVAVEDQ